MSVATINDTGELRLLAEQLHRIEHDPRRPGALDVMLLSVSIGAAAVVCACLIILTFAADHFSVEPGRIVLTMAAAGTCVAPVLAGMYGVNRHNRKRYELMMEKLDRIRCGCDAVRRPLVQTDGRPVSPSEYYKIYSDAMKDLGDIPPEP